MNTGARVHPNIKKGGKFCDLRHNSIMDMNMNVQSETICAPGSGILHTAHRSNDTFAVSFDNERDGDVVSPVRGTVTAVERGGGCVSIQSERGLLVQLDVGVPAYTGTSATRLNQIQKNKVHDAIMQSSAESSVCHAYVQPGDTVQMGQRLLHAELSRIRRLGGDAVCVVTMVTGDGEAETGENTSVKSDFKRRREDGEVVRAGQTPVVDVHSGGSLA